MTWYWWAAIGVVAFTVLYGWALCKAAQYGDEILERWRRDAQGDGDL